MQELRARWRGLAAFVSVLLVATGLAACAPTASAEPTADAVAVTLAQYGIATIPFAGGKAQHPVTGATVLALTDWQLKAVAASAPVAKTGKDSTAAPRFVPGIQLSGLDVGAGVVVPPTPGSPADPAAAITPSALIMAWWAHGTSTRAKLARVGYPAPTSAGAVAPFYVLTLFLADSLGDLGRTRADSTADRKAGESGPFALGTGPLAAPDPCGTVAGVIGDVNDFVDSAGTLGAILKTAVGYIGDALETALGPAIKFIKIALEITNVALNAAMLLQEWRISLTVNPTSGFAVAYNGNPGVGGTITLKLNGSLGDLPNGVASCLSLAGLTDPSKLSGSKVDWSGGYEGYQITVSPSEIVPPASPLSVLDNNNQAKFTFTTGNETLDTDKPTAAIDKLPQVDVHVKRADISKLAGWIVALGNGDPTGILHGVLYNLAAEIGVFVGDPWGEIDLPVQYWVPEDEKPIDPGAGGGAGDANAIPPVGNCLAPAIVQDLTKLTVTKHYRGGAVIGGNKSASGLSGENACYYEFPDTSSVVIEYPYTVPAADAPGFEAILTDGTCGAASGYLPEAVSGGNNVAIYAVFSGHSLADTALEGQTTDPKGWLPALARLAGLC